MDSLATICKCKLVSCSGTCNPKNKLLEPTFNSALRNFRYMEELQNQKKSANACSVSSNPKVSKKLNFAPTYTVFKNLIPVNINDSLLPNKKVSFPKKYVNIDKIPPPELFDFLKPLPPHIYIVPEPIIKFEFYEYEYNIHSSITRYID